MNLHVSLRRCAGRSFSLLLTLAFALSPAPAQTVVHGSRHTAHATPAGGGELRASRAFEAAKKLGPPELYAFLKTFPKGGDLHMHLSGAVYAETFIAEASAEGLCVAPPPPACTVPAASARETQSPPARGATSGTCLLPLLDPKLPHLPLSLTVPTGARCGPGQLPSSTALEDQPLYDALVDSFSMRGYVPTPGITGHDHFFATFARFSALKNSNSAWLDEVATRAASQNEQYLEVMQTPDFTQARELGYKLGWPAGAEKTVSREQLGKLRDALLAGGLRDNVSLDRKEFADALAGRHAMEHCGPNSPANPDALTLDLSAQGHIVAESSPGCSVQIRFLYQVLRAFPPQQVFAQTVLAFEVAQAELDSGHPHVVGLNFVQPEDAHLAMRDYHLQMLMLDYLHSVYPKVRITLHAGELALGMVPPDGLTFHIREAIDLGHAERIGHGMDVLYEDRAKELLAEIAEKHIMVEVNLTSNDVILGETRTDHPLAAYRAAHVPIALSTDDEGVSRIDLTHEYVKAAEEQNLNYADLKRSARTSLEHSFLPGPSLWARMDDFTQRVDACASAINARSIPSAACPAFLKGSPRAAEQYELERRLASFEDEVR